MLNSGKHPEKDLYNLSVLTEFYVCQVVERVVSLLFFHQQNLMRMVAVVMMRLR